MSIVGKILSLHKKWQEEALHNQASQDKVQVVSSCFGFFLLFLYLHSSSITRTEQEA
jgi:hypothetical protein